MGIGFLLDSDMVIAGLKKRPEIAELEFLKRQSGPISISVISLFEVWDGIFGSRLVPIKVGEQQLKLFLKDFIDNILSVDQNIARCAGEIRAKLRKSGELIGNPDILIAATCIVNNFTLVTKNKRHFGRIKDLSIF